MAQFQKAGRKSGRKAKRNTGVWSIALLMLSGSLLALFPGRGMAQITPDETLGNERSQVTHDVTVRGNRADRIDGGARRGATLFHSFRDFNVGEGQRVYFADPAGVENILGRVTGNDVSKILGTLGVDGGANLFLINPNGIVFGRNARLDISGSFTASTGNRFTFLDGSEFSATNPQAAPLLVMSAPTGVQFGTSVGAVTNEGNLTVGRDLALSGGTIASSGLLAAPMGQVRVEAMAGDARVRDVAAQTATLSASQNLVLEESQLRTIGDLSLLAGDTVRVRDSVVNPFVAAAGGQLLVQGNQNVDIFALNHPSSGLFSGGDMVLRSANAVGGDAHYWTGGSFRIEHLNNSLGSLFSPNDPIIRSQGDVSFYLYTGGSLHILAGGSVTIDTVIITHPDALGETINQTNTPNLANVPLRNVPLPDGTSVNTSIDINGSERPTLDIRAGVNPAIVGIPLGTVGNTPLPELKDGAEDLTASPFDVFLDPPSNSNSYEIVPPPSNNPEITDSSITIGGIFMRAPNGVVLLTNKYERNPRLSGNISITRSDFFERSGTVGLRERAVSASRTQGEGGSVIFDSNNDITIPENRDITTSSGAGNGGNVTLLADGNIKAGNVVSGSLSDVGNTLNSGEITLRAGGSINTGDLSSQAISSNGNTGNGGRIILRSGNSLTTGLLSSGSLAINGSAREGGSIALESTTGSITTQSLNSQSFAGNGNAASGGDITLNANTGAITTNTLDSNSVSQAGGNSADGGNVELNARDTIENKGDVNSNSFAREGRSGIGGSVDLESTIGSITTQALTSQSFAGNGDAASGGSITLSATEGAITTNTLNSSSLSQNGGNSADGGNVELNARDTIENKGDVNSNSFAREGRSGIGGSVDLESTIGSITTQALTSQSFAGNGDAASGGSITLSAIAGAVNTGELKAESGSSDGNSRNGGSIDIASGGNISTRNIDSDSVAGGGSAGNGGGVSLRTTSGSIQATGRLDAGATSGSDNGDAGKGGDVILQALAGNITIDDIRTEAGSNNGGADKGGDISVDSRGDSTLGNLNTRSFNSLNGNGGNIHIRSTNGTITTGSISSSGAFNFAGAIPSVGNRGNVTLDAYNDLILSSPLIDSAGSGTGGNITLTSRSGGVSLTNGLINSNGFREGSGGDILISGRAISVNNTDLFTTSSGSGEGGSVVFSTPGIISLSGSRISTSLEPGANGRGGDIKLDGESISLSNFTIDTATFGQGDAGNVSMPAKDNISLNGSSIFSITNGQGNAGDVTVQAGGNVSLLNSSNISTAVDSQAVGNGGDVTIRANSLLLTGGSQLQALTRGRGNLSPVLGRSGDIQINAAGTVEVSGIGQDGFLSGLFTSSEKPDSGQGGDINITARNLYVSDGAVLSAQTTGAFNGGNINTNVEGLRLTNGGQLLTNTFSNGAAGDITINATGNVLISNVDPNFSQRPTPVPLIRDVVAVTPITTLFESEPNDSIGQAQSVDTDFSINGTDSPNPLVDFSTRIPYVSVSGKVSNSNPSDYYSYNVATAGTRITADIDGADNTNTALRIFDGRGNLIASNDNAPASLGSFGSSPTENSNLSNDPYLRSVISSPGRYFIQVAQSGTTSTGNPQQYSLQLSLDTPRVTSSVVSSGAESGLFAQTEGIGAAGNVTVNVPQLTVQDRGQITVRSAGTSQAGNLAIHSREISLLSGARISAENQSSPSGGNISIQGLGAQQPLESLRMNNSTVSASIPTWSGRQYSHHSER